ncbi:substrate-binding domain-containing protein [Pseudarthrobacter sp. BRE9]|uniref:vWA domain-containing protein n=1 Tax=Pseudarthrobacter sp. BRE9 TaxID=2962582 RepID=UPI0028822E35|nr:substrate-binding domain-containing protein [Pseudarthrobacter sp. BRE9]MDT0168851.1 substrate-binding domain-containing protein [Pseudarthrobacter sp. BRE9]
MGRRHAAADVNYPRWIWIAASAVVVLLIVGGAFVLRMLIFPTGSGEGGASAGNGTTPSAGEPLAQDSPAAIAGASPCISLNILTSLENAEMVRALVSEYVAKPRSVDGRCVTPAVTEEKSGVAAGKVASRFPAVPAGDRPSIWLPDSSAWLRIAAAGAGGSTVPHDGTSVARSAIVVALPEKMAGELGWDGKPPSWSEVFAMAKDQNVWGQRGHGDWGKFKFGKASPLVSTSGLMALAASYGAAGGSVGGLDAMDLHAPPLVEKVRAVELGTSHYMATPEHFLWHTREADDAGKVSEFLSAVVVDEKSVWDYNRGVVSEDGKTKKSGPAPKEPLRAIYPNDGVHVADNPAVVLDGDWVGSQQRLAARDFIAFAVTEQGQQLVKASGYRSIQGALDAGVAETGRYAETLQQLPLPKAEALISMQDSFPDIRKRARALFLLDVSDSMVQEPGVTKLQRAKDAVRKALDHFTGEDEIGLAAFSHVGDGPLQPGIVSPVAPFKTNKEDIVAKLGELQAVEATPLFEAVSRFAGDQAKDYKDTFINTIVLLSDGKNDSRHPGDLAGLSEQLSHQNHSTPVLVFTLAYGPDADVPTLREIARASGAHYYDATDPNRLEEVLGELVTSF